MSLKQSIKMMLPPAVRTLAKRVRDSARKHLRSHESKKHTTVFSDDDFRSGLRTDLHTPALFARQLRSRATPCSFHQTTALKTLRKSWEALGNARCASIIILADQAAAHCFDLLGSGPVNLGKKIDWHRDFKSGERWEPVPIERVPTVKGIQGTDIKVPWELSRFYHAPVLGVAYLLSGRETYAHSYVGQITDWIRANPVAHGANWLCAMEVAIRAGNWVAALPYLLHSSAVSDAFLWMLGKSLVQHGRHIRTHLEGSVHLRSNHYLSDLQGLLYLGILFPEFSDSAEWVRFGAAELEKEMLWEVYPDGTDFEASSSYHRLCLELFLGPAVLCKTNGVKLSDAFWQRLEGMFLAVRSLMGPSGKIPLFGDNDSGRLHRLAIRDDADLRYLLPIGAALFNNASLRLEGNPFSEEALLYLGPVGASAYEKLAVSEPCATSTALPDSGWYMLRRCSECLHITCGPNGQKFFEPAEGTPVWNGGHAHNDKLSIVYSVGNKEVLVDPGQYCYTSDAALRNHSRGTAAHNTLQVNDLEQQTLKHDYLFNIHDERARPQVTVWSPTENGDAQHPWFRGEHHGYDADAGVVHKRSIWRKEKAGFQILDELVASDNQRECGELNLTFHFHAAAGLKFNPLGKNRWDVGGLAQFSFPESLAINARIETDFVAPAYSVKVSAQVLRLDLKCMAPAAIQWSLSPAPAAAEDAE